jgi:hypothetical protein
LAGESLVFFDEDRAALAVGESNLNTEAGENGLNTGASVEGEGGHVEGEGESAEEVPKELVDDAAVLKPAAGCAFSANAAGSFVWSLLTWHFESISAHKSAISSGTVHCDCSVAALA